VGGSQTQPLRPAQDTHSSGSVRGTVKDAGGGVIPNAAVTLTDGDGITHTSRTSADGSYTFRGLTPGNYSVAVTFNGFEQAAAVLVSVASGQVATANVIMTVETQRQQVTVNESVTNQVSTEPSNNASALVLKKEDLEALPDDPDDLQADLQALAGPSAGPGGNQVFIDGFTGGRLPPKSSIREIRINSNPFSAEYDKLGYGRIEIFTKPGTDKFHGQTYYGLSDGFWNSRNPFLTTAPPFKTQLFGGNVSGPLSRRASFFLDVDRRNIDDNGIINATIPSSDFLTGQSYKTFYSIPQRRTTVSPRVDLRLTDSNTLSLRYAYLENAQLLTGVGSFNLPGTTVGNIQYPSSGYSKSLIEHLFQVVDTAVLSPRVVNETHFQFARDSQSQKSQSTTPQLNVANSFVAGGSGYSSAGFADTYDIQNQSELQNYTSVNWGTHMTKFGFRIRTDVLDDFSGKNFNGTYSFLGSSRISSLQQYLTTVQLLNQGYTSQQVTALGYGPSLYTVSTGAPQLGFYQLDFGPFIQDDWRIRPNLTLSAGLRWEGQTNISEKNDSAPRVGFAWSPNGSGGTARPKTVIRGGWGMFYDRFQASSVLSAYRFNGGNQVNYTVANPDIYNSAFMLTPSLNTLAASSTEQRYVMDRNLRAPRLMQTVFSVERQLFAHTTLSVSFMNSRGTHELRTVDINAPLPGTYEPTASNTGTSAVTTGVRPYGNVGDIYLYESSGIFKQTQLITGLNTSIGKRVNLFSRYIYGQAHSDTDGLSTMPANPYDFSAEYGRSALDIRHLVLAGGSISGPWGIRLSPFFIARSGIPFNITTGTDLYGTGSITPTARPSMVSSAGTNVYLTPYGYLDVNPVAGQTLIQRNAGIGPGFLELNLRLSKTWGFGSTKFEGPSGGTTSRQGGGRGPGGGGPGPGGGGPPPGGGPPGESSERRYNLTLSLSARNALNHENLNTPNGAVTSPYFLQSTGITGGFGPEATASNQRRLELQLRFSF
jgi:hypothetical protein